jgi:spore germination protein GerM
MKTLLSNASIFPRMLLVGCLCVGITTATLSLSGCSWYQPKTPITSPYTHIANPNELVVFFSHSSGSEVITEGVVRPLPKTKGPVSETQKLQWTLESLLKGPSQEELAKGFMSEIPSGVKILGITQNNQAIRINLSGEFLTGGGSNSMMQRLEELKNTVILAEKTTPVFLDVDGKELSELGGEGLFVEQPINMRPTSEEEVQ